MYKSAIVFLLLFFFSTTAGCGVKPTIRQIAESIEIDNEWTELRPTPPLVVSEQIQSIAVAVPNPPAWDIHPDSMSFTMPGGESVTIEVELIAADGRRFSLQSIGLGAGLMFSRRPEQGAKPNASRLPQGMTFTAVRFRSSLPLTGGPVSWICLTNY